MKFVGSWARRLARPIHECIGGTFSLTTQSYIELNVKRGQQFYINEKVLSVASGGGTKEYLFRVGPDPVILKSRIIKTNSSDLDYQVFVGGDLVITSDGTSLVVYNANGVTPKINQSTAFEDPIYTGTGILNEIDWVPGSEGIGNRSTGAFSTSGFEKVIPANAEIITRFTNNGSSPADIFYFLTFYEGDISPLGDEELIE